MLDPRILARPGTVLLDSARPDAENPWSWAFTAPKRVLTASTAAEVGTLVETLQAETARGHYVAGHLSYEAGYPFVDLDIPERAERPLAWFGVYDAPHRLAPADVAAGLSTLGTSPAVDDVRLDTTETAYVDDVRTVRRHIGRGNVYQINYTAPLRFRVEGDPRGLYRRLRARQRVPYAAYLHCGDRQLLSLSPELFFRRDGDRLMTRPMKGTIRRGRTRTEDQALQDELAADPKNRAENLMIVDLLRNDLSVCCQPGSVTVPSLYETEPYQSVTQMTSTVEGRLRDDAGLAAVLRALFPCGSITGAPKRRAMRIIRELEAAPRGVYCGAIGMAGPDDTAVFNVAIRTAVLDGAEGTMGIGSGIVWDSTPAAEYEECVLKGTFLTQGRSAQSDPTSSPDEDLKLIETMRAEEGRILRLDRHVARLARSADYFSFPFDEARFRRRVDRAVAQAEEGDALKVRATLDRWGRGDVETTPLRGSIDEPWRVTVADEQVDAADPFFYHKTTRRGTYERALTAARDDGFDEAILLNQAGHVTEGTYSNVFVRRGDALWTPPVDAGLLAGVYRDSVLETRPEAVERPLGLEDLRAADALYCCNAVRGWCEAELAGEPEVVAPS
ncbi:aminodeoxychorismate synthase component I [Salinibacter altiplanensis]|uniref:aminodeoxychorismate synthase component I n=1 Tax=Salinibacter altiplanensis TaxID=1803181 RepID=UPI000C9F809F|nr:aminodeoxychorismate synthase component I [Salinibacter altiplanensis]